MRLFPLNLEENRNNRCKDGVDPFKTKGATKKARLSCGLNQRRSTTLAEENQGLRPRNRRSVKS